jgi:hypothetical protein
MLPQMESGKPGVAISPADERDPIWPIVGRPP